MRLRDNASYETIEERTLSEADRKVRIEFDRVVWLGSKQKRNNFSKPMRIIQLHYYDERTLLGHKCTSRVSGKKTFRTRSPEHTLLLATGRMDLSDELIGLIYRYRWQIGALLPMVQMHFGLSASPGAFTKWYYYSSLLCFDCQSVNPIVDWPQANQTYLRNDMFVLSGMGFPGGTHSTYRRT